MEKPDLDHVGIAVPSLDEGVEFYRALGLELAGTERVEGQGVTVGFIPVGDTRIELLEPLGPQTPIGRHIEKRGPGMHHLCFRVPDIRAAMSRLSEAGYRLLSDEPQRGAHGCLVCFVHPKAAGGVLIELSQPDPDHESTG